MVIAIIVASLRSTIQRPYCLLLFITSVLLVYIALNNFIWKNDNFVLTLPVQAHPPNDDFKVILLWTEFFGSTKYTPLGRDGLKNAKCPEYRCEVTTDRRQLSTSDAVVFHSRDINVADVPRTRNPHQKWVFYCLESPHHSYYPAFRFMKYMFNWTMSYRIDSDVITTYGEYKSHKVKQKVEDLSKLWKGKHKMAAWLVSHCSTPGNREGFVDDLKKYIDVDIFGDCGEQRCPSDKLHECLLEYAEKYFFFFALENSVCKDYITEKFFRMLKYDMVPVVFGGSGYSHVAPPNSYIDALSFRTNLDLAKYLTSVANNYTLYKSYFAWRESNYLPTYLPLICKLCEALYSENVTSHRVYPDIAHWWVDQANCRRWE